MDGGIAAIIAAGIASLVSLIVFIGSNIFSRINADKPYKIEIYRKQLFKVFTPLELLLEKNSPNVTPELIKNIRKIIYPNIALIPNKLLSEYENLKSGKKQNTFALRDIVSTYYNLRKKELGYPYKRYSINISCLDDYEGLITFIKSLKNPAWMALILFLSITILSVLLAIVDINSLYLIGVILLIYVSFTFVIWIYVAPSFKRKGLQYKKAYEKPKNKANKNKSISPPRQPVISKSTAKQNCNNKNQY